MKSDVQKFCRKLRLREFFGYDTSTDNSLVRNKSNWAPNRGRDSHLDCFIDTITKFPVTNSKNFKQNISKAEQRALEKLKQDETIVIKEADKGGAIVIMDKDYYREKVLDQLNDGIFYKKHSGKKTVMKKIKHLIEHHPNSVTEKEADYLCNFQIKDSNFYGLPKVHKSSEIITAVEEQKCSYIEVHRPKDLKLRPIVAGPESETQRLSHFLDLILKPICEKIPSFVRDDMDFLNHIPPEVPDSTILASFDVTSLYTNIPHDLGLTAANFWIEKHRDLVDRRFKTDFLLSALQIVLEGNIFNFDGQTYEQMKGTAMGTKVAPTYANLVMGYLEYKLYEKVKDEFDDDFKQYILEQWKRIRKLPPLKNKAVVVATGGHMLQTRSPLIENITKIETGSFLSLRKDRALIGCMMNQEVMPKTFWDGMWNSGNIPWHTDFVHPQLIKHIDKLYAGNKRSRVLVPFCGKSLDIKYLYDVGHDVVGIEWAQRAVEEFFSENKISYKSENIPTINGTLYTNGDGRIRLYCCDFFLFTVEVENQFDCVWERGDFSTMSKLADRKEYSKHLMSLIRPGGRSLIENLDYTSPEPHPPYPLLDTELEQLFADNCDIEAVETFDPSFMFPPGTGPPQFVDLKAHIRLMTKTKP
ncbi:hypothetical protein ScPMuIL_009501 [Solemya velum]